MKVQSWYFLGVLLTSVWIYCFGTAENKYSLIDKRLPLIPERNMSVKIFFGQVLLYFISYEIHFEYISYVIFKIFNWTPKRNPKTGRHEDSFLSSNTQGGLLLCLPICSCGRPYLTYYGIGGRPGVVSQIITIHYNSTWGGVSLETPRSWYMDSTVPKRKRDCSQPELQLPISPLWLKKFLFLTENWQEHLKSRPEGMDYEIEECNSGCARAGLLLLLLTLVDGFWLWPLSLNCSPYPSTLPRN